MAVVFILTGIALVLGIVIYFVNRLVPHNVKGIEKTEEISSALPGINCGACGYPGCFAYAQALTANPNLITETPCPTAIQSPETIKNLEKTLDVTLDTAEMSKKALVHCNGNSEILFNYSGVKSCKGAAQLLNGYKKCPYACLGFGDCIKICPQDAITINPENGVAFIDQKKCIGCGLCITECPQNIIELIPVNTKITFQCSYLPLRDIPSREKCNSGCTHCRKCFRSCEADAITWNKDKAIPEFDIEKCTLCHKCVEICPQNTLADYTETKVNAKATAG
ncbi:MAG: 4Fe-4S binding protein [Dehalococcoidales bacterium]|nr:4Fe-4S binding protein [Dehalococcoidales bacterium]